MNKKIVRKLLNSPNTEDALVAFHMMRDVKYSDLEDFLGISEKTDSGYYVYPRLSKEHSDIWDMKISEDIAVCVGTVAILFMSTKWYKDRHRTLKNSIYE